MFFSDFTLMFAAGIMIGLLGLIFVFIHSQKTIEIKYVDNIPIIFISSAMFFLPLTLITRKYKNPQKIFLKERKENAGFVYYDFILSCATKEVLLFYGRWINDKEEGMLVRRAKAVNKALNSCEKYVEKKITIKERFAVVYRMLSYMVFVAILSVGTVWIGSGVLFKELVYVFLISISMILLLCALSLLINKGIDIFNNEKDLSVNYDVHDINIVNDADINSQIKDINDSLIK